MVAVTEDAIDFGMEGRFKAESFDKLPVPRLSKLLLNEA